PVGSENELTAYSLLDPWTNMPNAEKLYYRVTALGFNGNTFFSDILLLQRGADFDIQIGPNPVVTGDNFRVTILGDADFIDIIDSNGRKIFSTTVPEFERVFTYPTSFLGRGWFAVRVRSSETEKVKKFIVINPQ
ncbi:MAG: T9SS type A sorting domain-containing protein, partial [Bacteroidota bacterium]